MTPAVLRQLTVAIENQPGRLADIAALLAGAQINIRDLAIVDNIEQGVIRLTTSDPVRARALLGAAGHPVVEAGVLAVVLPDTPGSLARLCRALAAAGINIDYAYGTEDPPGARMRLVLKVSNLHRAEEIVAGMPDAA